MPVTPAAADQKMRAASAERSPRVVALEARFREIDETMRGLPIHNAGLDVGAIDFHPFASDAWVGVLLTPWFMNVIILPQAPTEVALAEIGSKVTVELPGGKVAFVVGGDNVIGRYLMHSLVSPVLGFATQAQAEAEARRRFAALMEPPAEKPLSRAETSRQYDRRALLFGRG
jgi:[NiFe] hydrogenase assembly HybE family chaperone